MTTSTPYVRSESPEPDPGGARTRAAPDVEVPLTPTIDVGTASRELVVVEDSAAAGATGLASWQSAAVLTEMYRTLDVAIVLSVLAAIVVVSNLDHMPSGGVQEFLRLRVTVKNAVLVVLVAVAWQKLFFLAGLYDTERIRRPWDEQVGPIVAACTLGCVCAFALPFASNSGSFSYLSVGYVWLGVTATTLATRYVIQTAAAVSHTRSTRNVLVVGTGPRAQSLERKLQSSHADVKYRVVGFVESSDFTPHPNVRDRTIGTLDELENILMHRVVDEVLIALPVRSCYAQIQRVIQDCERAGVACVCPADMFNSVLARPRYDVLAPFPAIAIPVTQDDHRLVVKRLIDVFGGVFGLVALLPAMLLIAAIIKIGDRGPVIFAQRRIGFRKRQFKMFKFRTMVRDAESLQASLETVNEASGPVFKIRRDPRVTRFGRFLRRTSLDELPQLFNVIRGEMSLVGPRPLPLRDVGHFTEPWLMRRFSVLPGLTCLWQIQGRSDLGFDDWVALDLKYIDEWSLSLDCRILLQTVPAVLRGRGAS